MSKISGDTISKLPVNNNYAPKSNELEFVYNLFQPKNQAIIKQNVSVFSQAFIGTVLFVILSLPFIEKLITSITKDNKLYGKLATAAIFFIAFFICEKVFLGKK